MSGLTLLEKNNGAVRRHIERLLEAAVVVAALATIPVTIAEERKMRGIETADWAIWSVFLVDYLVLLAFSSDRRSYVRSRWLDAAIVLLSFPMVPSVLEFVRLARLARLLRLLRLLAVAVRALRALQTALGRSGLLFVTGATVVLVFAGGGILTFLEPGTVKGDFWNGVWWAVVTTTTVGYGDIAPSTLGGRLVGVVLMFVGVGMAATLAASIAAYFVEQDVEKEEKTELKELSERLDRIETLLRQSLTSPEQKR